MVQLSRLTSLDFMSHPPLPAEANGTRRGDTAPVLAISAYFFCNGAAYASWVPRLPDIKRALLVSDTGLGLTLVGSVVGSLAMSLFFAPVIHRFGSRRTTTTSTIALAGMLPLVALAPSAPLLFAALACFGSFDAFADVSVNSQAMQLQRKRVRSIMTRFHGMWSVGALAGGLVASRAAAAGVSVRVQLIATSAVLMTVAASSERGLLPSEADPHYTGEPETPSESEPRRGRPNRRRASLPSRVKMLFVAAGAAAIVAEIPATEWATLMVGERFPARIASAGLGFIGFACGMVIGRFVGDRVTDSLGPNLTLRTGSVLTAVAFVLACSISNFAVVVGALGLAGIGCSWLNPLVVRRASDVFGGPGGATLCGIGARLGILVGTPLMGRLSDLTGRSQALLIVGGGAALATTVLRLPDASAPGADRPEP